MSITRLALGALAAAAMAQPALAGEKPLRGLLGAHPAAPKAPKTYPLSERHYIKQFAGPSISCGACFGFYHTQWRSWAEACNEPQPYDPGPQKIESPVEPIPELEIPKEQPPAPKESPKGNGPKDTPKEPAKPVTPNKKKVDAGSVAPMVIPPITLPKTVSVVVPEPSAPQPVVVRPIPPVPARQTIIVPLNTK